MCTDLWKRFPRSDRNFKIIKGGAIKNKRESIADKINVKGSKDAQLTDLSLMMTDCPRKVDEKILASAPCFSSLHSLKSIANVATHSLTPLNCK